MHLGLEHYSVHQTENESRHSPTKISFPAEACYIFFYPSVHSKENKKINNVFFYLFWYLSFIILWSSSFTKFFLCEFLNSFHLLKASPTESSLVSTWCSPKMTLQWVILYTTSPPFKKIFFDHFNDFSLWV